MQFVGNIFVHFQSFSNSKINVFQNKCFSDSKINGHTAKI